MCIWVFALAVDEADRMMGTLQIFAGLITFLFVAGGDTPKVPYQTRLDLFMLWSFFNVAVILFIHGTVYYWRECDIEDILEEREKLECEIREKHKAKFHMNQDVEMAVAGTGDAAASSSSPASPSRVYVNDPAGAAAAKAHDKAAAPSDKWKLREDPWSEWTFPKWFRGLHVTRKVDAISIPVMAIMYSIGTAVILGRPASYEDPMDAATNN